MNIMNIEQWENANDAGKKKLVQDASYQELCDFYDFLNRATNTSEIDSAPITGSLLKNLAAHGEFLDTVEACHKETPHDQKYLRFAEHVKRGLVDMLQESEDAEKMFVSVMSQHLDDETIEQMVETAAGMDIDIPASVLREILQAAAEGVEPENLAIEGVIRALVKQVNESHIVPLNTLPGGVVDHFNNVEQAVQIFTGAHYTFTVYTISESEVIEPEKMKRDPYEFTYVRVAETGKTSNELVTMVLDIDCLMDEAHYMADHAASITAMVMGQTQNGF